MKTFFMGIENINRKRSCKTATKKSSKFLTHKLAHFSDKSFNKNFNIEDEETGAFIHTYNTNNLYTTTKESTNTRANTGMVRNIRVNSSLPPRLTEAITQTEVNYENLITKYTNYISKKVKKAIGIENNKDLNLKTSESNLKKRLKAGQNFLLENKKIHLERRVESLITANTRKEYNELNKIIKHHRIPKEKKVREQLVGGRLIDMDILKAKKILEEEKLYMSTPEREKKRMEEAYEEYVSLLKFNFEKKIMEPVNIFKPGFDLNKLHEQDHNILLNKLKAAKELSFYELRENANRVLDEIKEREKREKIESLSTNKNLKTQTRESTIKNIQFLDENGVDLSKIQDAFDAEKKSTKNRTKSFNKQMLLENLTGCGDNQVENLKSNEKLLVMRKSTCLSNEFILKQFSKVVSPRSPKSPSIENTENFVENKRVSVKATTIKVSKKELINTFNNPDPQLKRQSIRDNKKAISLKKLTDVLCDQKNKDDITCNESNTRRATTKQMTFRFSLSNKATEEIKNIQEGMENNEKVKTQVKLFFKQIKPNRSESKLVAELKKKRDANFNNYLKLSGKQRNNNFFSVFSGTSENIVKLS